MNNVRRIVNPIEWLAYIYGKVFVGYPWFVGYIVAVLIGGGGAALLWMGAIDKYNEQQAAKPIPDESGGDSERPNVHLFEVKLQIHYDEEGNLQATSIMYVIRNLGKRSAINVKVVMWLGYDTKPDMTGEPTISDSIPLLEPGPYNPALNNNTQYLSGGWAKMPRAPGPFNLPPFTVGEPVIPPTPPPFDRKAYLIGTVAFDDPLTKRHYDQTVCFEQPFGWPHGRPSGPVRLIDAEMSPCKSD